MANLTTVPANARPLDGSRVRRGQLSATAALLDAVYITDDDAQGEYPTVAPARANAAATADSIGVIVAFDNKLAAGAVGDGCSIVVFGPVAGFDALAPGARGYLSAANAGKLADAAGTVAVSMGYAESDTVFFVMPGMGAPSS